MNSEKTAIELIKDNKQITITVLIYAALAVLYFFPAGDLRTFLPDAIVKYRIIGPLLTLTAAGIFLVSWPIELAMLFSLAGDFMGAYGSFVGQMACFAFAHAMFIYYFSDRFRSESIVSADKIKIASNEDAEIFNILRLKRITTFCISASIALVCIGVAIAFFLPSIPAGVIRTGCGIYSGLICIMVGTAILQRDWGFGTGAVLFLISDAILAWNKFVEPLEYSKFLVLIPYYTGQLLIWLRASVDNERRILRRQRLQ